MIQKKHLFSLALLAFVLVSSAHAQEATEQIRLNQVGFYPDGPKRAVVANAGAGPFYVTTPSGADTVFAGTLGRERSAALATGMTRLADFSSLQAPGTYVVRVPGAGRSYPFAIASRVHEPVAQAALKAYYFQRASTALPEEYAGRWQRAAGHPDTAVVVHPSAATEARPPGTRIAAPKGWYDAGDYNKYIVNSGISTATLLSFYEDFPDYATRLTSNIPESDNALPDVLDEALWNIRWMLAMQDPADGGVYTKLTHADFQGMVMPAEATERRYVIQKSTAATLDFAAVMAQASRVYRAFESAPAGLADSLLAAAKAAWQWAREHPDVPYRQRAMNRQFDPDIETGGYGDETFQDEFIWAAAELYATTRNDRYYEAVNVYPDDEVPMPSWGQVRTLGYYTLARHRGDLTPAAERDAEKLRRRLIRHADALVSGSDTTAYYTVMGQAADDFGWGSNSLAANQGIALVRAYELTGDRTYLDHALANLDYLLGRNATGYSFVTGIGDETPMHPHHRPSEADGVRPPVPGLLVGGPNPDQQDDCDYPSDAPALSYVDAGCSYASNEITINWNAPLVYLAGALEALQDEAGYVRVGEQ